MVRPRTTNCSAMRLQPTGSAMLTCAGAKPPRSAWDTYDSVSIFGSAAFGSAARALRRWAISGETQERCIWRTASSTGLRAAKVTWSTILVRSVPT